MSAQGWTGLPRAAGRRTAISLEQSVILPAAPAVHALPKRLTSHAEPS